MMKTQTLTNHLTKMSIIDELEEQAQELIDLGNSKEAQYGLGMREAIDKLVKEYDLRPIQPKYQYLLYTWGGFYNDHNVAIHGITEEMGKANWFDTLAERDAQEAIFDEAIKKAQAAGHNDVCLIRQKSEGFDTRTIPKVHRIVEYKGKQIYSTYDWSFPGVANINTLQYHKEYKWYPGFNDYAVENAFPNEKIDYRKIRVIQEWITGAFNVTNE